jgi:hypothetical protein
METLPDCDWEVFKKIRPEMLEALCARINGKVAQLVNKKGINQHDKYLKLNKHIRKSYKVVSNCFDDFSKASLPDTLEKLRVEGLLTDRYIELFSPGTQEFLKEIQIPRKFLKS